jgi:hypothetical protein
MQSQISDIKKHGFTIIQDAVSPTDLEEIKRTIAPLEAQRNLGRTDFEGTNTIRVYSLAGLGDGIFMKLLAENPKVTGICDELLFNNYLLSTFQSIRQLPGEKGQEWHTDDSFYAFYPRPRPGLLAVSAIFAIEDFTANNGATEIIPDSHLWGTERPGEGIRREFKSMKCIMPAGSVVVFDGSLWHRGGTNHSTSSRLAISPQYCNSWLRTQESQLLICPPSVAAKYSDKARALLGYSLHPPFLGQVNGMHPLRLIDPNYSQHKTGDRAVADFVLKRPKSFIDTSYSSNNISDHQKGFL